MSLDLEHGGEYCGIVKLSCQLFWLREEVESKLVGEIENESFNEYIKLQDNAIWDEDVCKIHGLSSQHQSITNADPIVVVWKWFIVFLDNRMGPNEKGVLVAWNGETCDLGWIDKICQAPNTTLAFPEKLVYFYRLKTM